MTIVICSFEIKKYFKYHNMKYLIEEFSKKLNYTSRGIYLHRYILNLKPYYIILMIH